MQYTKYNSSVVRIMHRIQSLRYSLFHQGACSVCVYTLCQKRVRRLSITLRDSTHSIVNVESVCGIFSTGEDKQTSRLIEETCHHHATHLYCYHTSTWYLTRSTLVLRKISSKSTENSKEHCTLDNTASLAHLSVGVSPSLQHFVDCLLSYSLSFSCNI